MSHGHHINITGFWLVWRQCGDNATYNTAVILATTSNRSPNLRNRPSTFSGEDHSERGVRTGRVPSRLTKYGDIAFATASFPIDVR